MAVEIANVGFEGFNPPMEVVVRVDEHGYRMFLAVCPLAEVADRVAAGERGDDEDGEDAFHGIIRVMKDWLLCFFKTWNDVIVSLSAVVTAVSALVAVLATLKHWRDDKVRAVFSLDEYPLEILEDGLMYMIVALTIVNAGKTPFTVGGVRFLKKEVAEGVDVELVGRIEERLDQGAAVKARAHLYTTKNMITFPERFEIGLFSAEGNNLSVATIKPYEVRPAIKRADGRVIQPETGYAGQAGVPSGIGGMLADIPPVLKKRIRKGKGKDDKNV